MITTTRLLSLTLVVLAPAAPCVAEAMSDDCTPMGAPASLSDPTAALPLPQTEAIDAGTEDTVVPALRASGARAARSEHMDSDTKGTQHSAAATLAALDETQRANANVQLELLGAQRSDAHCARAAEISSWWNDGRHDQALAALEQLEVAGASFAVSISWKEPIVSAQKRWYLDVRIGAPRESARKVVLDYDPETDNLFAAVSWSDGWTMNISTDDGASWQETSFHGPTVNHIGMAVSGDHVWVAFVHDYARDLVLMRRNDVATGAPDSDYSTASVAYVGPHTVHDLTLGSNADSSDNRVYPAVITSNNNLRFYWADLTGTTFHEASPPVGNADDGLDFTWNKHDTSGFIGYVSYLSTGNDVVVWRVDLIGNWDQVMSAPYTGVYQTTRISAALGNVYVAYGHSYPEGHGAGYRASYNNGGSWSNGDLYRPGAGDPEGFNPDLSLRSGVGSAGVILRSNAPVNQAIFTTRRGFGPGSWSDPLVYSNHDLGSGFNHIEWLGTDRVMSYGMVYLAEDYIPYFDLMTPRAFFADAFESGDLSEW